MTTATDIYKSATALLARLPKPNVSAKTMRAYLNAMKRMLAEAKVDPLRQGDARDTYNFRRAALHAGAWHLLDRNLRLLSQAVKEGDRAKRNRALSSLEHIVERCSAAIELDRPMDRQGSSFDCGPSRWSEQYVTNPPRGKGSKKHVLPHLPEDWMDRIWRAAAEANWKYLDALAVHMLTPVRPIEFVPGLRDGKQVAGIKVCLMDDKLGISFVPAKSHGGKYGTEQSEITVDATNAWGPVSHLVRLCVHGGGTVLISLCNTNAMRKSMEKLAQKTFSELEITITPYLFRHQNLADLKATVGAGGEVAAAAGHCTDRTQSRYGRVQYGRKRPEFISAVALHPPTCGNVERARELAEKRRSIATTRLVHSNGAFEHPVGDINTDERRNGKELQPFQPHRTEWVDPEQLMPATTTDGDEYSISSQYSATGEWGFGVGPP